MRTRNFQNRFTTGRFTLPAVIAVAMACWLLGVLLLPPQVHQAPSGSGLWQSLGTDNLPLWLSLATSFLLHGLTGWILIELNNAYAIIRMRASVQTAFYLLFVSACPLLHRVFALYTAIDIGTLFMNSGKHTARITFEHVFAFGIADTVDNFACHALHINICFGFHFSCQHYLSGSH